MIGGPLILIRGLTDYLNENTKIKVAYSGFMVLFGIYYV
jgi:hypothetical protein